MCYNECCTGVNQQWWMMPMIYVVITPVLFVVTTVGLILCNART